ncbi:hypothetical protein AB4Z39_09510 [Mycobacterium adipatum]|jgi:hypothetical protein|uniref:hypothetical protein n=1 Tax=Mycobacterium adipatum TaxID=1682113 RepID=UPI001C6B1E11|nr:hypothetical protein [Mycolicibacterium neoaurum]
MRLPLWKRNVIGAAVAAAAVTLSVTFISGPAWERYRATVRPAHSASTGESVVVDGQSWSVRNVSRSTKQRSGAPLPEGTVLMNVLVERSGTAEAGFACVGYLFDGERSWRANGPPCGAATSMPWTFTIPATAEPTAVDIRDLSGSILLRLQL